MIINVARLFLFTQLHTKTPQLNYSRCSRNLIIRCNSQHAMPYTGCPKKKCPQAYWVAFKNSMT